MSSNVEVQKCAALFAHSVIVKENKTKEKYVISSHLVKIGMADVRISRLSAKVDAIFFLLLGKGKLKTCLAVFPSKGNVKALK